MEQQKKFVRVLKKVLKAGRHNTCFFNYPNYDIIYLFKYLKFMREKIDIILKYSGTDVDDGSMSVEDIIPALQGFASAYGKIAALKNLDTQHKLRVTGVQKGSFHVLLEVWDALGKSANNLTGLSICSSAGLFVVAGIIKLISLKKHVRNEPYTEKINSENQSIIINNSKNVSLEVPIIIFNIFKEKILDIDINKIVRPLEEGRIDSTCIEATYDNEVISEKVEINEKKYFDVESVTVTKTQETWLVGKFNSLTKSTNKGFFILTDGTRVSYQLISEKPELLYHYFIYSGPVKVRCVAHMDENLKVASIDIYEIQKLQTEIFDSSTQ